MSKPKISLLPDRGIIRVRGVEARSFLQGIVSNDTAKITADTAGHGAFLTPQGKYLFDFFMLEYDGDILIETERHRISDFIKRLNLYKLRADVTLEDVSTELKVLAAFGKEALDVLSLRTTPGHCLSLGSGVTYTDPRVFEAGARFVMPREQVEVVLSDPEFDVTDNDRYDTHRISLGLPDASRDMVIDKSVLLENSFDELNGIDWHKGCYMGQEVTARTKHRGLLKKRLLPVTITGMAPDPGTTIMAGEKEAGEMRSSCGDMGMALIKLDYLDDQANATVPLTVGETSLKPIKPDWMTL